MSIDQDFNTYADDISMDEFLSRDSSEDDIMDAMYTYLDNHLEYYNDALKVLKKFNAYDGWQEYSSLSGVPINSIMQVAYAVLEEYLLDNGIIEAVQEKLQEQ